MSEREFGSIGGRGGRSRPRLARDLTRSQLLRGPKDADWTCVKRDPIIVWQSVVAFAPRGPEGAERYQNSPVITSESLAKVAALAADDWTNCFSTGSYLIDRLML